MTTRPGFFNFAATALPVAASAAPSPEDLADVLAGILDLGDDDAPIPPRAWLLGNVFARKFPSSLLGDGGTGKTAVRIAQTLSLGTGRALTGEHVFERCRVLYASLEDDKDELRRRFHAARKHYGVPLSAVKGWVHLWRPPPKVGKLMKMALRGQGAVPDTFGAYLREAIKRFKIDMLILDPFVKTHAIPENDNAAMDKVAELLTDLADELNIGVDFPQHTRKGVGEPGNADMGRGASAVKDAARLVYTLMKMTQEEANQFGIPNIDRKRYVRMDDAKVNITPPAGEAAWFYLQSVNLENPNETYRKGDNVQVAVPWTPPELWQGCDADCQNAILNTIAAGVELDGVQCRYSKAPKATDTAAWQAVKKHLPSKTEAQCRAIITEWVKSGALYEEDYKDQRDRKTRKGLFVDDTKRPGAI